MKKVNPRRFEFSEIQTAAMWVEANRDAVDPRDPMETWLPWILCGVLMLMVLGLREVLPLSNFAVQLTLSVIAASTVRYTIRRWSQTQYFWNKVKKMDVDSRCEYTYWIEGDFFYAERWKGKRCVRLSSFQRMTCRKGLVMLTTGRKWEPAYVFSRNKLPDDQWREFCGLIQAANPKFKHPFQ